MKDNEGEELLPMDEDYDWSEGEPYEEPDSEEFFDLIDQEEFHRQRTIDGFLAKCPRALTPLNRLVVPEEPQWLIEGLLPDKSMGLCLGERGVGKSALVYDMALHIATGTEYMGRKVKQRPVVVIPLEGRIGAISRLVALRERFFGRGKHVNSEAELYVYTDDAPFNLVYAPTNALDYNEASYLLGTLATIKDWNAAGVGLVIIDTLAVALAGQDENGQGMMAAIALLQELLTRAQIGLLLIHHPGYGNPNRARGHSSLEASMDYVMVAKHVSEPDKIARVECTKMKDGPEFEAFMYKLGVWELGADSMGVMRTAVVCEPNHRKQREGLHTYETAIVNGFEGQSGPLDKEEMFKSAGLSDNKKDDGYASVRKGLNRALCKLLEAGTITVTEAGYFLNSGT